MLGFTTTLTLALGLIAPTALAAPSSPIAARTTTSGTITGNGTIQVVVNATSHSISFSAGSPSQAVGCLNAVGQVVLDDCAVYTAEGYHVSTTAGVCSFNNASQPANTDDVYGANVHAFSCWDHAPGPSDVQFYTVSGMAYDFLGQGDSNLVSTFRLFPIPLFYWGGGVSWHTKVLRPCDSQVAHLIHTLSHVDYFLLPRRARQKQSCR